MPAQSLDDYKYSVQAKSMTTREKNKKKKEDRESWSPIELEELMRALPF